MSFLPHIRFLAFNPSGMGGTAAPPTKPPQCDPAQCDPAEPFIVSGTKFPIQ
ncbi:MAG: hypothetical protein Q4C48_05475 [Lachnospiraceae bacterium]|nr:hypothetical protein [Lachnospiraceae bacterium]